MIKVGIARRGVIGWSYFSRERVAYAVRLFFRRARVGQIPEVDIVVAANRTMHFAEMSEQHSPNVRSPGSRRLVRVVKRLASDPSRPPGGVTHRYRGSSSHRATFSSTSDVLRWYRG